VQPRIVLTIAGSDSGGGAGIQADLRTFAAHGVHGTTAITCLTAQNPRRIAAMKAVPPAFLTAQLEAISEALSPKAIKTGMLHSAGLIRRVVDWVSRPETLKIPLIIDPVLVSTSGTVLLQPAARRVLCQQLFPRATLITPNLAEAGELLGRPLKSFEDLRTAALDLHFRHGCAVLVKGGHLRGGRRAVDVFFDGTTELELAAPVTRGLRTHGTGCVYSAAITGYMALGLPLASAVEMAKQHITQAIHQSVRIGEFTNLNPFWLDESETSLELRE
jgi:hydroxymethylpyrimidine/phosphomethylpyrimidine kinase